jgi:hypothetical protein
LLASETLGYSSVFVPGLRSGFCTLAAIVRHRAISTRGALLFAPASDTYLFGSVYATCHSLVLEFVRGPHLPTGTFSLAIPANASGTGHNVQERGITSMMAVNLNDVNTDPPS